MNLVPLNSFMPITQYLVLWTLLQERTPQQSISHKEMPEWSEHINFVNNHPYKAWYLICEHRCVPRMWKKLGAIYLTQQNEIGIQIFNKHRGKGLGKEAVQQLMRLHPGPYLANINPNNDASIAFFKKMGFEHIQNTYRLEQ